MKKLIIILFIFLNYGCCNYDIEINEPKYKEIKLTTINLLSNINEFNQNNRINNTCTFPDEYIHEIPDKYNVYFINPKNENEYILFENVTSGEHTYKIPIKKYKIIVTNGNYLDVNQLPKYIKELVLYGENLIDFTTVDSGIINVKNYYASVLIVKNDNIINTPKINNIKFDNENDYYLMYINSKNVEEITLKSIRNEEKIIKQKFERNKIYRYLLCLDNNINIIVGENIFNEIINQEI